MAGQDPPADRVPTAFLIHPNFHSCFYNSIETGLEVRSSLRILASQVARRFLLNACFFSFDRVIKAGRR